VVVFNQNPLRNSVPSLMMSVCYEDEEEVLSNKTLPSIQYSVSLGNSSQRWSIVSCNFWFTGTLNKTCNAFHWFDTEKSKHLRTQLIALSQKLQPFLRLDMILSLGRGKNYYLQIHKASQSRWSLSFGVPLLYIKPRGVNAV